MTRLPFGLPLKWNVFFWEPSNTHKVSRTERFGSGLVFSQQKFLPNPETGSSKPSALLTLISEFLGNGRTLQKSHMPLAENNNFNNNKNVLWPLTCYHAN